MQLPIYHISKSKQYPDGFKYKNNWYAYIDIKLGIGFSRKGDEVILLWPWNKYRNKRYCVVTLGYTQFDTLKEIDEFWKEYHEACKIRYSEN